MPTDSYLNALASLSEEQFGSEKLAFFGSKSSPKPKKLLGHFHLPVYEGDDESKPVDIYKHPHYEGDPVPQFGMPVEFHPAKTASAMPWDADPGLYANLAGELDSGKGFSVEDLKKHLSSQKMKEGKGLLFKSKMGRAEKHLAENPHLHSSFVRWANS